MTEPIIYTFKIDGFTPESMPFGRLVAYYDKLEKVLGLDADIHLVSIDKGSHLSGLAIAPNQQTSLSRRIRDVKHGTAPRPVLRAMDDINAMLEADGVSGALSGPHGETVIQFPGRLPEDHASYEIRERARFTGELYAIAGHDPVVKIRVHTAAHGVVLGEMPIEMGRNIGRHLFKPVRVEGHGVWTRSETTPWKIRDFVIDDFKALKTDDIQTTIERIRKMNIQWPDNFLDEMRAEDDEDEVAD